MDDDHQIHEDWDKYIVDGPDEFFALGKKLEKRHGVGIRVERLKGIYHHWMLVFAPSDVDGNPNVIHYSGEPGKNGNIFILFLNFFALSSMPSCS